MKQSHCRFFGRLFALVIALLTAVVPALPVSAAMPIGYSSNRLEIAAEPDESSRYMEYFKDGEEQDKDDMSWVEDAERGTVLALSGENEYLQLTSEPLPLIKSTFTAWVNWEDNGGADPVLFSMASNVTDDYITFSLHRSETDRQIDGLYFHFWHADGDMEVEWFNPVSEGISYDLPQNEWHHIAYTVDGQYFRLYIDGQLWFEQMVILSLCELQPNRFYVGSADPDSELPTLKAKLDNVYMYDKAMTAEEVLLEMQTGINPYSDDIEDATTTTSSLYYPTAPSAAPSATAKPTAPTTPVSSGPIVIAGFPLATLVIMGLIVVLFIGLSIGLSIHQKGGGSK